MGDSDDDSFVVIGSALEPIEEDEVARKKPVNIQDQIVTDEQGRRRFHGAFTGGFSAGYYNTVGSAEGWAPATFKSSRSDRTAARSQAAQDFMDEEDIGAFGIAPQVLRPTEDFKSKRRENLKRPRPTESDGPIPGEPVLHRILEPVVETVGIKVLRKMGWRPGQGIGAKVPKKSKKKKEDRKEMEEKPMEVEDDESTEPIKIYGCALPPKSMSDYDSTDDNMSDDENMRPLLVAPKDVDNPVYNPKENTFGLGYKGLDKNTILSGHVNLFGPSLKFKVDDRKMNITGEAFGIGVFEDQDEEVYNREDMSQYDFALETPDERKRRLRKEAVEKKKKRNRDECSIPGFIPMKNPPKPKHFPPPRIPQGFVPVHAQRKSRFADDQDKDNTLQAKKLGLDRHQLSRQERQVLLEDEIDYRPKPPGTTPVPIPTSDASLRKDSTSSAPGESSQSKDGRDTDVAARLDRLKKFTEILQTFSSQKPRDGSAAFKPFLKHPGKQERYDKYLTLKAAGYSECLKDLQPQEMTEWERDREKNEFDRASELYKPMSGEMSSRFVSAKSHDISHVVPEREREKEKDPNQDPKVAAKMNLFGKLTHQVLEWHPDRLVCKRFNVPAPYPDSKMVGVRVVGTAADFGTKPSDVQVQEPKSKKSLFEDLDFSKPPPGLVPVASDLPGASSSSTIPSTSLEFLSEPVVPSSSEEAEKVPTKPPLDLFKEIFADTSSESEDEEVAKETELSTRSKDANKEQVTRSTLPGKEGEKGEQGRKRDDKKITLPEVQRGQKGADSSTGKMQSHEKNPGIFHNLDFSKLSSMPIPSTSKTLGTRNEEEHTFRTLPNVSQTAVSSTVSGEDDAINEEPVYGPTPPSTLISKKQPSVTTAELDSGKQVKRDYNYSSSSLSRETKSALPVKGKEEESMWVEKDAGESSASKKKKKHSKKSHKSHHHKHKSKKTKKASSKHKSKKHKHKSSKGRSSSTKSGHRDGSDSSSSSSAEDSDSSSDSVIIHTSESSKALIAKLKEII